MSRKSLNRNPSNQMEKNPMNIAFLVSFILILPLYLTAAEEKTRKASQYQHKDVYSASYMIIENGVYKGEHPDMYEEVKDISAKCKSEAMSELVIRIKENIPDLQAYRAEIETIEKIFIYDSREKKLYGAVSRSINEWEDVVATRHMVIHIYDEPAFLSFSGKGELLLSLNFPFVNYPYPSLEARKRFQTVEGETIAATSLTFSSPSEDDIIIKGKDNNRRISVKLDIPKWNKCLRDAFKKQVSLRSLEPLKN